MPAKCLLSTRFLFYFAGTTIPLYRNASGAGCSGAFFVLHVFFSAL
jgi:hypothetical protein